MGDEKFRNLDASLPSGQRGLPKLKGLAQLLRDERGHKHHLSCPNLSEEEIILRRVTK